MCPHKKAWDNIKNEVFKTVTEITRKTPWGFKEDLGSIYNISIDEYLNKPFYSDTIILHILLGEGEDVNKVQKLLDVVYDNCVKLIVIEHNHDSLDWKDNVNVTKDRLDVLLNKFKETDEEIVVKNLERNIVYCLTTLNPLHIPQLSDQYYKDNIDKKYVLPYYGGICTDMLIYLYTSEKPCAVEELKKIPDGKDIWWVVGGGLYKETIGKLENNNHILIDSVLLQTIYSRVVIECNYDTTFINKINSLYDFEKLKHAKENTADYGKHKDYPDDHWRNVTKCNNQYDVKPKIKSIKHLSLVDLKVKNSVVYVSTVGSEMWQHLCADNVILSSLTPRDIPKVIL